MDKILNLTKNKTINKLLKLFNEISKNTNIPFVENRILNITISQTHSDINNHPEFIEIGTKQIREARFGPFKSNLAKISDMDFTNTVINTYHEYAHCVQQTKIYAQTPFDKRIQHQILQQLVCVGDDDYYWDNYLINAEEIQAEQYGINSAYQYLCDEFPDISTSTLEQLIVSTVNHKITEYDYFIKKPCKTLHEIQEAFDKAYDQSFQTERIFNPDRQSNINNPIKPFMNSHPETIETYRRTKTPFEQDKCLATINMHIHNLHSWITNYKILQSLNLSYENDIETPGKSYLKNPIERQQQEILMQLGKIPPDEEYKQKQIAQQQKYQQAQKMLADMCANSDTKSTPWRGLEP